MRIFFLSYQAINLMRGGVTFKTQQLKINLEKLGVDVQFYDSWDLNLKLGKNDLVHIFNANVGTYHMAESLRNYGTKYVVNPIFYNHHNIWKLRAYLKVESLSRQLLKGILSEFHITKTICENAERILPNTEAEGDILVRGIGVDRSKMEVIENGVERRFINSHNTLFIKKYGLKDFILFVGHLGAVRKNGRNIIQALKQIDHPSVIIADVLNNPEGDWCRKEIEKSRNIKLIDWVDHKDPLLESAYAACKTFILPTRYETPGRAALEAGLAGANIVITPFGGTKEYFRDFAEYADPHSVKSIKEKIEKSLNKDKNNKLKDHIQENFLWDVIAKKTAEMYQQIIK